VGKIHAAFGEMFAVFYQPVRLSVSQGDIAQGLGFDKNQRFLRGIRYLD
jgi:hypothetical protein